LKAKKTARQYAAFEHASKFALHKLRHIPAFLFLPGQKRFEILLQYAVDERVLRLARAVLSGRIASRTAPGVAQPCSALLNLAGNRSSCRTHGRGQTHRQRGFSENESSYGGGVQEMREKVRQNTEMFVSFSATFIRKRQTMKRFKDDASEVTRGYECGIGIQNFKDITVGDIIEACFKL
jgi:hypothetical protein